MSKRDIEKKIEAVEPVIRVGYSIENNLTALVGDTVPFHTLETVLAKLDEITVEVRACISSFLYTAHVDKNADFDYIEYLRQSDISPFLYYYYNRIKQVLNNHIRPIIGEQKHSDVQQKLLFLFKEVCKLYNHEFDLEACNKPFENRHYKFLHGITDEIKTAVKLWNTNIPNQNLDALFHELDRCENEISVISDLDGDLDGWYEVYFLWDRIEEILEDHLQEVSCYSEYMQIRSNVLGILQRKCNELDLMNKFEYFGDILRRKSLKRVQWEQQFIETNYEKENYGIKCDWREIVNKLNGGI